MIAYEDFIVVENMKSQFYYVFVGDGGPFVSPFVNDEAPTDLLTHVQGLWKQDLTVSEYEALVISHIDKISKKGESIQSKRSIRPKVCRRL